jgi:tetratricopeptide (TPR) repeat protein
MRLFVYTLILFSLVACGTKKNAVTNSMLSNKQYLETFHSGIRYKLKGQHPEAIRAFDSCLVAYPKDDAAAYGLSQCYLAQNDLTKASEYIIIASKLDPKNIAYTEELAYMYYKQGQAEKAEAEFKKLVEHDGKNVEWLFAYAELSKGLGKTQQTIDLIDKIVTQTGNYPDIAIEKFNLYRSIKQDDKAFATLEEARKKFPDDVSLIATMVDYYFEKNRMSDAQNMLSELVKKDPSNGPAQFTLGQLLLRQGKNSEAQEHLIKGFESTTIPIDNKMELLFQLLETQPNPSDNLVELAQTIAKVHPDDAKGPSILGDIYFAQGKKVEALQAFKMALKLDDTKYPLWKQTLLLEYENEDYQNLYSDARKCSAIFPTMIQPQLLYTIACNKTKKHQEAITAAETAKGYLVREPKVEAELLGQQGEAYFSLGKIADGKKAYDEALKVDPTNLLIQADYAFNLARFGKEYEKAFIQIEKVNQIAPNQAPFIDIRGMVSFFKGDYELAKTDFEKALTLEANDKDILDHLGDAFAKLGNGTKAVEYWGKALKQGCKNKVLEQKISTKKYLEANY